MHRPFALPGTRPRYAPDRIVDVEHYRIELTIHFEARRIAGSCAITLTPILENVRRLELDAVELDVAEVRGDAGQRLDFSHDGKRLKIDFGKALTVGQKQTIVVSYSATPRRGLYFIAPDEHYPQRPRQVWTQGQDEDSRHWFPCFDSPHEKSTSELVAHVPDNFYALSNGSLVDAKDHTFHWRFDIPHSCYLITLVAGEFAQIKAQWQDIDVLYYCVPGREHEAERALGRTPEMLDLFSKRFGRYPYGKYAQVCVAEFIFGGMENTTATTLTDNCLFDERAALDYDVEALVAHELAHQWFGDLVTCRDWGQGWLNEGFATYSEYIWREHAHGRDEAALELMDWADQYFGEDARRYRRPIATNVYEEPIDIFDHHLYEKGGLVLHMLRRILGEAPFWKALGHYVHKHRTSTVATHDLARAVEEATGRALDWFFEQWIHKAGHPELKVDYTWDGEKKLARFTVKQTQKVEGDTPLFRLPLEVRFRVGDRDVNQALEIKEPNEVFYFPLEAEPAQAIFDTGQHVLKKAEVEKPKPLWLAELTGASEAADRIAAAKGLAKHTSADVVAALDKAMHEDAFWGVRAACAETLGAIRSPAARDVLVKALSSTPHPKARRAVARALGDFRNDEAAAAALEQLVLAGDQSYFVEAEACLSLGKTRSPRATTALRKALERDSYLDVVRQHAYRGLAEARDDSAVPVLLEGTKLGKMSQGRRAAVGALAALSQGRHDREGREVREKIEDLLTDEDFRVQQTVIEALAVIGDAKAIPALRRAVDTALDGRIRRRGREVMRDLEEGRSRDEATRTLRDELDKLRLEMASMRDRLGKMEASGKPNGQPGKPNGTPKKPPARPPAKSTKNPKATAKSRTKR